MQTQARVTAFGALSELCLNAGCLHEIVQEPVIDMHGGSASQKHGSDFDHSRVAASEHDDEAAGQGGPCELQQVEELHLGDSSWWYALYNRLVLASGLEQHPALRIAANKQGSGVYGADPDAWGWTAVGMKIAVFPNALDNGQNYH